MKHTNESTMPGPGDEITWPPYTGNPNDPRWEDEPEEDVPCSTCGCLGNSECGKSLRDCSLNDDLTCPCCAAPDFSQDDLDKAEEYFKGIRGGNLAMNNDREVGNDTFKK